MLDVQRQRQIGRKQEILFTRRILIAHLAVGWLIPALLLFHHLFFLSAAATAWLLITLGLIVGVTTAQDWCRLALGLSFVALAVTGFGVINFHPEAVTDPETVTLTRRLLPIWGGIASIAYGAAGVILIASVKVRKAVGLGFTLW
ncbi:MAG: hypothetical protein KDK99_08575 [Verrucomicrobiales bacterium]|nr:hypothetical protein [Verrucomicrobiales bacterium]